MKKLISITLSIIFGLSISACYDDSAIRGDISDLQKRVTSLELLCSQMNSNIIAIQTTLNSLNQNDYITQVSPILDNGEEVGYKISFLKSAPITIYNGKNGINGKTPQISVRQHVDGAWYWVLDGEWLLDDNGNKVRASGIDGKGGQNGADGKDGENGADGKDGITPQLKIVDNYWYLSLDNGTIWKKLGKSVGEDGKDGDSMFKSVTHDDKYAYFTLIDGTVLTIPMSTNLPKLQFVLDKEDNIHLSAGKTVVLNYTIISPVNAKTTFQSYESENWKVAIKPTSKEKGTISITAPNPVSSGKILFTLSDDYGNVFVKTLEIIGDDSVIKIIKTKYTIDEFGGYLDIAVDANLDFQVQIAEDGKSWIETISTGETTRLQVSPNSSYSSRESIVSFKGTDGVTKKNISITQIQNNAIVVAANEVNVTEAAQTYNLVVKANIGCKLTIEKGKEWISLTVTKSLDDKIFPLTIKENEDYPTRNAILKVSDTSGKITQMISITQDGYTPVIVDIQDERFLNCLVAQYDINKDGKIDQKEAKKITSIECTDRDISSLAGIENFTNLTSLSCSKTKIAELDLSHNIKLSNITCQYNEEMTSLTLPAIQSINDRAFLGNTALQALDLPKTITAVGKDAFQNCIKMEMLSINSDINTTYINSFSGCGIKNLRISGDATSIPKKMFYQSALLEHVKIGENVSTINTSAFEDCLALQDIIFEKYSKLQKLSNRCFSGCKQLVLLDMRNCSELVKISDTESRGFFFGGHTNDPRLSLYVGARVPPSIFLYGGPYNDRISLYVSSIGSFHNNFCYDLYVQPDCVDAYKQSDFYNSEYVTLLTY